jgi:osmotically-inducible protein OsmY
MFGMLCGMALACTESNPPASSARPTDQSTAVTPNRTSTSEHPAATTEPADRTNTGVNVRDRASTAKTPIDQKENKADLKITADIRKQVVDEKMSVDAHNVKIITQDGKVTLRGPVKTEEEKQRIEEIAAAVAGADRVDSQLEVAAK